VPEQPLKTWFNTKLEPDYLNPEILNIYYNAYIFNLKSYAAAYRCFFISPADLHLGHQTRPWVMEGDPYLRASENDNEVFLRDLLENGTYWHMGLLKTAEGYSVSTGVHRFQAIQTLMRRKQWPPAKKLLAVTEEQENREDIPPALEFYVPIAPQSEFKKNYSNVYGRFKNDRDKPFEISDNFVVLTIPGNESSSKIYCFAGLYTILLREAFYEYKIKTKWAYPPHKAVNNEKDWAEWRPEDFTSLLRKF